MQARRQVVKQNTDGVAFLNKKNKITRYEGSGKLTADARSASLPRTARSRSSWRSTSILATGPVVATLPGMELDGKTVCPARRR